MNHFILWNILALFLCFYFFQLNFIQLVSFAILGWWVQGWDRVEYIHDDIYDIHQALYIHIHICLWDLCTFLLHTVILVRIVMTLVALIIMTIVIDLHLRFIHFSVCFLSLESLKTVPGEYSHRGLSPWENSRWEFKSPSCLKAAVSIYNISNKHVDRISYWYMYLYVYCIFYTCR